MQSALPNKRRTLDVFYRAIRDPFARLFSISKNADQYLKSANKRTAEFKIKCKATIDRSAIDVSGNISSTVADNINIIIEESELDTLSRKFSDDFFTSHETLNFNKSDTIPISTK